MNAWGESILAIVRSYPAGTRFTSDTVRKDAVLRGAGTPAHANAWGKIFSEAARQKLAKKTNRYFSSDIPTSNRRVIAEWEKSV